MGELRRKLTRHVALDLQIDLVKEDFRLILAGVWGCLLKEQAMLLQRQKCGSVGYCLGGGCFQKLSEEESVWLLLTTTLACFRLADVTSVWTWAAGDCGKASSAAAEVSQDCVAEATPWKAPRVRGDHEGGSLPLRRIKFRLLLQRRVLAGQ